MTRHADKLTVKATVARLAARAQALQGRELLAPLLPGGRIRVRLDGLVYEFRVAGDFAGWGRFRPRDERTAELIGAALPWQRAAYLELFPALRVILLWPAADPRRPGAWWALPFNESDARQRFRLDGAAPLLVDLANPTDGADRFERVIARVDGGRLWFDGPDPLADPDEADWLRAAAEQPEPPATWRPGLAGAQRLALLHAHIQALEAAHLAAAGPAPASGATAREMADWLRRHSAATRLEERLRHALAKADATLHGYHEVPGADGRPAGLVVEWSQRGERRRYRSTIDADLTVVASGICLSGRDGDFDLTSLVSVMHDA